MKSCENCVNNRDCIDSINYKSAERCTKYTELMPCPFCGGKAETTMSSMINQGARPQVARAVLPNSLKTELIMTANLREWRHFFKLRTPASAHPDMRAVAIPLLDEFKTAIPIVFEDICGGAK